MKCFHQDILKTKDAVAIFMQWLNILSKLALSYYTNTVVQLM